MSVNSVLVENTVRVPKTLRLLVTQNGVNHLYVRNNVMGAQTEWWHHNAGCGLWFLAERRTRTNEVIKTYLYMQRNA